MSSVFSVRQLIRDQIKSGSLDVAEIARKVAPQVPEEFRQEVLEQALQGLVREVLAENRPRGEIGKVPQPAFRPPAPPVPAPAPVPVPAPATIQVRPAPAALASVRLAPVPQLVPARPAPPSPASAVAPAPTSVAAPSRIAVGGRKGAEIRDAWQRVLDSYYTVEGERKKLGELTYDDCQWIATDMERQADALKTRARGFRALGSLLLDHQVRTIRDLPAEIKMQALGARS